MTGRALASVLLVAGIVATPQAQAAYKEISFETLLSDWNYNPKEPWEVSPHQVANAIPAAVKALDGQKVAVYGATTPLDYKTGVVSQFILGVSADVCAFGATPRINEWISVTMNGGRKTMVWAQGNTTVRGTLHVSETVEDGRVIRLYRMDADSLSSE